MSVASGARCRLPVTLQPLVILACLNWCRFQGMKSIIGDIRDGTLLTNVMQQAKPDIVIRFAQPLVRCSMRSVRPIPPA